ncbi:hypothetical protein N7492_000275 [Penicillium capsulatum]|uniref:Uncharacterized protein n=1 Tax=Penicillium capsulatum TaxID=69766 RepID=A0A9W9IRG8_9EURO|nr:hypothetical protein N7492_000275 [Penicillium capsulatum]KAJ6130659.1 hypothetical protein N7512_003439 [Penicillium capsulatum]
MTPIFWIALLAEVAYCAVIHPTSSLNEASQTSMTPEAFTTSPEGDVPQSSPTLLRRDDSDKVNPKNTAVKLPKATGAWLTIPCDKYSTTDQNAANMTQRYLDAGVPEAWDELMSAWESYLEHPTEGTSNNLRFHAWMSNVFNGFEGNSCDYFASSCQSATCAANGLAPATYIIQNNFNYLWNLFYDITSAYTRAADTIRVKLGEFTATFAPKTNTKEVMQNLLEAVLFVDLVFIPTGFAAMAEKGIIKAGSTTSALVSNGAVASSVYVHNMAGNYLKDAKTLTEEKVALEDFLTGYLLNITQNVNQSMSPLVELRDKESRQRMRDYIVDGTLNVMDILRKQTSPDRSGIMQDSAEKILWAMLIQPAWRSVAQPRRPFILKVGKEDYKCNDPLKKSKSNLHLLMSEDTRKKTIYCGPDGNSYFLLHVQRYPSCSLSFGRKCQTQENFQRFIPLPGGDAETLKSITGITIGDIVHAQYGAYLYNGKHNGYTPSNTSNEVVDDNFKVIKGELDLPLSGGLRIPGAFNISVCTDATQAARDAQHDKFDAYGAPCRNIETTRNPLASVADSAGGVSGAFYTGWIDKVLEDWDMTNVKD